jgi:predicted transposase/invertase (TIGR01784 family)
MLERAGNDVEFYEYIRQNAKEIKGFSKKDWSIFNASIKIIDIAYGYERSEKIKEIFERKQAEEANEMLTDMIENAKKEKEELIEKGKMEKALEAAINFLKMGLSVEQVAKGTGLTAERVQKAKDSIKIE